MSNESKLFDFLSELINIQIKKYVKLASLGVGPDARLNAALVYDEVKELLNFAQQLLEEMKTDKKSTLSQDSVYLKIFNQVKFYVEQEHERAYASWLLDNNPIHSTVDDRTSLQLTQLKEIAKETGIDFSTLTTPLTDVQKQCQYDSSQICFHILKLARDIKNNPEMKLDKEIPKHAQSILRKNASTRYVTYHQEIEELYQKYELFLQNSNMTMHGSILYKAEAEINAQKQGRVFQKLLAAYKKIEPNSPLFSVDHKWYKVASLPEEQPKFFFNSNNVFFGGVLAFGGLLIYRLIPYIAQLCIEENKLNNSLS